MVKSIAEYMKVGKETDLSYMRGELDCALRTASVEEMAQVDLMGEDELLQKAFLSAGQYPRGTILNRNRNKN